MVSKVPASQLLEHFAITRTSSPTISQAFRLLDLILHCKEEPQLPDLYQFFFLCLFPLHSATKSYPRWSASLISLCISLFQDCILVLGTAYAATIQRHYNLYKARSFLLESKLPPNEGQKLRKLLISPYASVIFVANIWRDSVFFSRWTLKPDGQYAGQNKTTQPY